MCRREKLWVDWIRTDPFRIYGRLRKAAECSWEDYPRAVLPRMEVRLKSCSDGWHMRILAVESIDKISFGKKSKFVFSRSKGASSMNIAVSRMSILFVLLCMQTSSDSLVLRFDACQRNGGAAYFLRSSANLPSNTVSHPKLDCALQPPLRTSKGLPASLHSLRGGSTNANSGTPANAADQDATMASGEEEDGDGSREDTESSELRSGGGGGGGSAPRRRVYDDEYNQWTLVCYLCRSTRPRSLVRARMCA